MHIDPPGGRCLVYSPAVMHLCPLLHWWMYPNLNLHMASSIWLMQDCGINHRGPALSSASSLPSPFPSISLPNACSLSVNPFLTYPSLSQQNFSCYPSNLNSFCLIPYALVRPYTNPHFSSLKWYFKVIEWSLSPELHPNFICVSDDPNCLTSQVHILPNIKQALSAKTVIWPSCAQLTAEKTNSKFLKVTCSLIQHHHYKT